tara:strand:+ start:380 stop:634 length:255 start_codon:yes stop_codon:yes gene_type:complete
MQESSIKQQQSKLLKERFDNAYFKIKDNKNQTSLEIRDLEDLKLIHNEIIRDMISYTVYAQESMNHLQVNLDELQEFVVGFKEK